MSRRSRIDAAGALLHIMVRGIEGMVVIGWGKANYDFRGVSLAWKHG
jgi:hypothetical protein